MADERLQCPNCGSYKVWRRGKGFTIAGIIFALGSIPWVFVFIGIPFLLAAIILTLMGIADWRNGNPARCRQCEWMEGDDVRPVRAE